MTTPSERAIRLAWDFCVDEHHWDDPCPHCIGVAQAIEKFAAEAVRAEREACAKVAEDDPSDKNAMTVGDLSGYRINGKSIARRIRARTPASGEEHCASCGEPHGGGCPYPKAPRP